MKFRPQDLYSTYSIVACDVAAGELGAAVQTHQMSVGSRVLWLEPGVGALATQSLANIAFGPTGLMMLKQGMAPASVIAGLVASDPDATRRQVALAEAGDVPLAADILRPALADEPRRAHWLDLLGRLQACGLMERPGAAEELVKVVG